MNQQPEQGVIRNVPEAESGVKDGVELMAMSSVTIFKVVDGEVKDIAGISTVPCKIMASYDSGVVSVSVRGEEPFMVSVRLDEMMALLQAAAGRCLETRKKGTDEK